MLGVGRVATLRALERGAAAVFFPLAWGTALLHLLFAVGYFALPEGRWSAMAPMAALDVGAIAAVGLIVVARRRGLSAQVGTFLLFAANVVAGVARLAMGEALVMGAGILLLQLAAASLLFARWSIVTIEIAIALGWVAVALRRGGDAQWVPWHFVVASGFVVALLVAHTRLSLFDRAESNRASLEESEARYRTLVEGAPDGVCVLVEGQIVFANPAALRIWGASRPEELIGRRGVALMAPESASIVAQRNRAVEREGVATEPLEVKGRRLDGRMIDLEIWGLPVVYGGRRADLSHVRDITDRKRAREQQERLAEVSAEQAVTRDLVRRMLSEARRGASMRTLGRSLAQDVPGMDLGDYMRAFEAMGFGSVGLRSAGDGRYELRGLDLLERRESAQPTCDLALGFLEGAISRIEGVDVLGTETRCQSQGHEACTFVLSTRRAASVELTRTVGKRS